jgi:TolB protein
MRVRIYATASLLVLGFAAAGCTQGTETQDTATQETAAQEPAAPELAAQETAGGLAAPGEEAHLRNITQLTFGGENAEAYFSLDGEELVFQSTREPYSCDQIFTMNVDGSNVRLVSTGLGRTTCAFFTPDKSRIIYASTHEGAPDCPAPPDMSEGYVWAIYPDFDIYSVNPDGTDLIRLTDAPGYDAEGTIAPDGSKILFTSTRSGDLELYEMNLDGSDVQQLTDELGYDGGAFHSPDGEWIVWRSSRPTTPEDVARYEDLLARDLVMPSRVELNVMRRDGSEKAQITDNGAANFAPYFFPDSERIIFSSNMNNPRSGNFDLFVVHRDGSGLEQITFDETFDGFPMFTADGSKIVWESNRNAANPGDTNVFIADWVD